MTTPREAWTDAEVEADHPVTEVLERIRRRPLGGPVTVEGIPGSGRSHVLHRVTRTLAADGVRVVTARAGGPGVLAQVLAGLTDLVDRLDPADRAGPADATDDRGVAGWWVRLLQTGGERPVVVVVDDPDGIDVSAAAVLTEVAAAAPRGVTLVRAASIPLTGAPPAGDAVRLRPLDRVRAARLLDAGPGGLDGRLRLVVLAEAAGNPLALVELGRVARRLGQGALPAGTSVPPPPQLVARFAPALADLSPGAQHLLAVAAAGRGDLREVAAATGATTTELEAHLAAAERAGLLHRRGRRVHFSHPVVRAAAYHRGASAGRRAVHRTLARVAAADVNALPAVAAWHRAAAAWHRAAAGDGPDPDAVADLRSAAWRLAAAGARVAAADVLVAASGLTHDDPTRSDLLALAARAADAAGETAWADLLTGHAGPSAGSGVVGDHGGDPHARLDAMARATQLRYETGRLPDRDALLERCAVEGPGTGPRLDPVLRGWAAALLDPTRHRPDVVDVLRAPDPFDALGLGRTSGSSLPVPRARVRRVAGTVASLLDVTDEAVRHLQAALTDDPTDVETAEALAWALLDTGRPDEALRVVTRGATERPDTQGSLGLATVRAVVATWRADPSAADQLHAVLPALDPVEQPRRWVRVARARGLAATAAGDHTVAYRHLRTLWRPDGHPVHTVDSDLAVADLASAAVRAGRRDDARSVLAAAVGRGTTPTSLRRRLLVHRAHALLGEADGAERSFRLALVDAGGEQWPVERALARLDYAEWLRRHARPADARPQFDAARRAFVATGPTPWVTRVDTELLASSSRRPATERGTTPRLTDRQSTIADLAASGMSNREIAERLYLSVRTVTTHLSRIYTELGVNRRGQLSRALDRAGEEAG